MTHLVPDVDHCPRCGDVLIQEFWGPCEMCRAELRQLQAPAPDPRFVTSERADSRELTVYAGGIDWSELRGDVELDEVET